MNRRWKPLPVLLLAYSCGIFAGRFLGAFEAKWILGGLLLVAWLGWAVRIRRAVPWVLALFFFGFGASRISEGEHLRPPPGESLQGVSDGRQVYEGVVSSYPEKYSNGGSGFLVRLDRWRSKETWQPIAAQARLRLSNGDPPSFGDRIVFGSNLRTPRNFGNDGEFDFELYSRVRGIDATGSLGSAQDWVRISPPKYFYRRWLNAIRDQASERALRFMDAERSSLFLSLIIGDRGRLSDEAIRDFRSAGVLHLLVVSGSHVTLAGLMVAFLVGWLIRRSRFLIERVSVFRVQIVGGAIGATIFAMLTDLQFPMLRAVLLAFLVMGAFLLERPRDALHLLFVTAFGLLLLQPLFLFDLSAQLSFGAVLGIVLALRVWGRRTGYIQSLLIATVGATIGTLSTLAFHFSRIGSWTVLGNFLFVPLLGTVALPIGFAAIWLGGPFAPIGNYLLCVLDRWLELIMPLLSFVAHLPGADVWVPRPSPILLAIYIFAVVSIYLMATKPICSSRRRWIALAAFVSLGVIFDVVTARLRPPDTEEVRFLHVGQGDAALFLDRERRAVLVDAGPGGPHAMDAGRQVILPYFRFHGIERLTAMVLTHGDADHVGGARTLLKEIPIEEIVAPATLRGPMVTDLYREARIREVPITTVERGKKIYFGGWQGEVLHPPRGWSLSDWGDNNSSLVIRFSTGDHRVLMTGDIEAAAEQALALLDRTLSSEILKAPHHGSRTSSTEEFLEAVGPKFGIFSAGWKNHFGHPAPDVLQRYEDRKIETLRGDLCGEIALAFRGNQTEIRTGRRCR